MNGVRVLVLRAAGINCDEEVVHGWRLAGAQPTLYHVAKLAENPSILDDYQIVTIPGGFSYGDDIAAGTILAQRIIQDLAKPLRRLVNRGGGIFGICNGFQVLVKAGLLPGEVVDRDESQSAMNPLNGGTGEISTLGCQRVRVTVTHNDSAKFEARWVRLKVCTGHCPFLSDGAAPAFSMGEILELPVEHAEGRVVTNSDAATHALERAGQIALRYVDEAGRFDTYPANPNGSTAGIAGLCDSTGRIFGLMPHPDRHLDASQHPLWTRRKPAKTYPPDGLRVFLNAVQHWSRH